MSPRSRRDRRTRTTRKSTVSASPRAMFRDLPAALGRHSGGHHQRPADHTAPHAHVQVGGARRRRGGTRCGPATGRGTRARPRRCPSRSLETVEREMPDSLPRARTRSPGLACGHPLDSGPSRSRRIGALSTRLRGWSREGKNDPVHSSGIAGFHLPGGGGHRFEALAVAAVGALIGARRGAARRSRRRPRTPTRPERPGPEQTAQDARPAKSGSARTSRISMDTAH